MKYNGIQFDDIFIKIIFNYLVIQNFISVEVFFSSSSNRSTVMEKFHRKIFPNKISNLQKIFEANFISSRISQIMSFKYFEHLIFSSKSQSFRHPHLTNHVIFSHFLSFLSCRNLLNHPYKSFTIFQQKILELYVSTNNIVL